MIISVQNQKGGVGKTTLAINISYVLSSSNKRVLLIDADPSPVKVALAQENDSQ